MAVRHHMAKSKATVTIASATTAQNTTPTKTVAAPKRATNTASTLFKRDAWVTLHHLPTDYSHHEALLLCETIPGEWVSWVPGYGEITLQLSEFY